MCDKTFKSDVLSKIFRSQKSESCKANLVTEKITETGRETILVFVVS